MKIYGIYDKLSQAVVEIIRAETDTHACRSVTTLLRPDSYFPYKDFPEDYKLVRLCDLDVKSMRVKECNENVSEFVTLVPKKD